MDTVDILYILGTASLIRNEEIRYSLRCLDRHGRKVGRVVLCGERTDFIGGDIEYVERHDHSVLGKHWNMLDKICTGIKTAKFDRPFLFSCDDHFITRDNDMTEWPQRLRENKIYTEEEYEREHGRSPGKYQKAVAATGELIRSHGLPAINTVWHGDMWIDPKYLDDVMKLAVDNKDKSVYGFEPMMLFEAFMLRDNPNQKLVRLVSDVKAKSFDDAMSYSSAYGCFSTNDRAWMNGRLLKWFRKNYDEKSRWER